jgi:hypothetical protein
MSTIDDVTDAMTASEFHVSQYRSEQRRFSAERRRMLRLRVMIGAGWSRPVHRGGRPVNASKGGVVMGLLTGPRPACRTCGALKVWSRCGWACPRPKCAEAVTALNALQRHAHAFGPKLAGRDDDHPAPPPPTPQRRGRTVRR